VALALGPVGINADYGAPHNPWHPTPHAPGGSSSGSGVAVAAGLVPMALGSDTGGSVRIPAGLCGTVGLKVTVGRISRAGVYPLSWSLDSVGPLTRGVEDAALAYLAMQGEDHRDETTRGIGPQAPLSALKAGVRGLRLAVCETALFEGAHPEVVAAFHQGVDVLRDLGAVVSSIELPEVADFFADRDWGRGLVAEGAHFNRHLMDEHRDRLDPVVRYQLEEGRALGAPAYFGAQRRMLERRARLLERLRDVEAFLAPTVITPAEPLSTLSRLEDYQREEGRYWHNTAVANHFGLCAVSVPCGWSSQGLPIGLMAHAKPFQEELALRVAHAFEQATDWHRRHPDLAWAQARR
jgi:aspartyl-tRNA(Asn)/glutamyl-tRNA(Gln) amidotransferase subunit A